LAKGKLKARDKIMKGEIRLSKYNVLLTLRRLIGISILLILGYLTVNFFIKFVFYIIYLGTRLIDTIFKFLIN
jgi:hypothetical protein